tara:strand:+ start:285 stop:545 length:261 start_codon:yes stop_codon:yes gene_type:complete
MGNKQGQVWVLTIYRDVNKSEAVQTIHFDTIKDLAYIVGVKPQDCSNFYHRLSGAKGIFKFISIFQYQLTKGENIEVWRLKENIDK